MRLKRVIDKKPGAHVVENGRTTNAADPSFGSKDVPVLQDLDGDQEPIKQPESAFHALLQLAQERINRAARRQQACLSGQALALGTLAGHLHQLLLAHCAEVMTVEVVAVGPELATGPPAGDNRAPH